MDTSSTKRLDPLALVGQGSPFNLRRHTVEMTQTLESAGSDGPRPRREATLLCQDSKLAWRAGCTVFYSVWLVRVPCPVTLCLSGRASEGKYRCSHCDTELSIHSTREHDRQLFVVTRRGHDEKNEETEPLLLDPRTLPMGSTPVPKHARASSALRATFQESVLSVLAATRQKRVIRKWVSDRLTINPHPLRLDLCMYFSDLMFEVMDPELFMPSVKRAIATAQPNPAPKSPVPSWITTLNEVQSDLARARKHSSHALLLTAQSVRTLEARASTAAQSSAPVPSPPKGARPAAPSGGRSAQMLQKAASL